MTTMKAATLWADPRTGVWKLPKRIPKRYAAVADQKGNTVNISSGTANRQAAAKKPPDLVRQWDALVTKGAAPQSGGHDSATGR